MMKILKTLIFLVIVLIVPGLLMAQDSNMSRFDSLKEPKISTRKSQKMLVVEAKGDPNIVGGNAFGLLFQLYYRIPETPKGPAQAAPRARWPLALDAAKSAWIGLYALPVPETVTSVPNYVSREGMTVSLTTWEYGEVAEILHIGPYDKEEPTINRLMHFIEEGGYEIIGDHEEEYIKGPSMAGPGDPEKYLTIIRYRVKKVE